MFTGAIAQPDIEKADTRFEDLDLSGPILKTLAEIGFDHPTPIQVKVIPLALKGYDIVGLAQTGSGKTAAFALPMADYLMHGRGIGGLILCPTREIALQSKAFLEIFGRDHQLRTVCLIGGARMKPQIDGLRQQPDIIVATPGRLIDHLGRGNLTLDDVEILVLDEADHMLDLGFLPQVTQILEALPAQRQTMMFSATMPPLVDRLAQRFMREPIQIDLRPPGRAAEGIEHHLYLVGPDDKKPCLLALAQQEPGSMLVFVRRKVDADWACRQLALEGHPVERMHSNLPQSHRVAALQGLRQRDHRILVATDIAARGIDIPIIQHIVNFNVPETVEDYIHRAGRTARGAAGGIVSTIATWQDKPLIRQIEKALGQDLPRCTAPGVEPYQESASGMRPSRRRRSTPIRRRL